MNANQNHLSYFEIVRTYVRGQISWVTNFQRKQTKDWNIFVDCIDGREPYQNLTKMSPFGIDTRRKGQSKITPFCDLTQRMGKKIPEARTEMIRYSRRHF